MMREPRCVMCGARAAVDGSTTRSSSGPWLLVLACLAVALVGAAAVAVAVCLLMAPAVVRRSGPVPVPAPVAPAERDERVEARRAFDKLEVELLADMAKGDFARGETLRDMKRVILKLDPDLREKLDNLERRYEEAYEAAAADWVRRREDAVERLEAEKKYDEAIRVLETYPKQLRRSPVWARLQARIDKLRAEKER